jgi:hypothetical protein
MADLTTLANVKEWLSTGERPLTPRDDAMLARLITGASALIEKYCSRPIGLANWQEVRDGLGGERDHRMVLAVNPITAITLLMVDGLTIPAAPPLSQSQGFIGSTAGYVFNETTLGLRGFRFTRGLQNVTVQYTAGYSPIPDDIEQACIELVARKYRERTRIAERTRSLGGATSASYETVTFTRRDWVSDIQVLVDKYRLTPLLLAPTRLPDPEVDFVIEDGVPPVTDIVLEDGTTPIEEEE